MTAFIKIKNTWKTESERLIASNAFKQFKESELNLEHFKSLMTELYFLFTETPKLFTTACSKLNRKDLMVVQEVLDNSQLSLNIDRIIRQDLLTTGIDLPKLRPPLSSSKALYSKTKYDLANGNHHMLIVHLSILGILSKLSEDHFYNGFKIQGIKDEQMKTLKYFIDNQFRPFKIIRCLIEHFKLSEIDVQEICTTISEHSSIFEDIVNDSFHRV